MTALSQVPGEAASVVHHRPSLLLCGFFGRGNVGDEAMLQVQVEALADTFDLIIAVDHHGAYDGFWDWYPYCDHSIVHMGDLSVVARPDVVGVHVGGGGLPLGFGAAHVVQATRHGKRAALTGTDLPSASRAFRSTWRNYGSLFDLVAPRSVGARLRPRAARARTVMGHDWAIGLATDEATDVPSDGAVTVVLREFPRALQNETYVTRITRLLDELEDTLGRLVRFLPFCPEDERFLEELALAAHRSVDVHWWNPRRVQQHIRHASLVVSVGRFHPLVFAANVGTPAIYLEPLPEDPRWPASEKAQRWCRRTGQPYVASWEEAFERQPWRTAVARPAVSVGEEDHERWAHMVENVRLTFLAGSRRREG